MDKFNSFASQAKAKAEQGRVAALSKIDQQRHKPASSAHGSGSGAGLATGGSGGGGSGSPPPTPPNRSRASSSASALAPRSSPHQHGVTSSDVFVGISDTDKAAFFSLLDEYFAARPQYKVLFNSQAAPLAAAAVAGHHNSTSSSSAPTPAPAPPSRAAAPPKPPPRATPVPRGLGTATALFDFDAGEAEDLGFKEGQKITILEHISDEWMRGELNGQSGIFPKVYVQLD
ncbi:BQ2448_4001 [Microbotryum intermedium]|uniref:BQ2448_4001 protein n=1 Tax=Microbotryum intermedium TaxID=269621 RepID=A0A238FKQ4_9BASI|nr:BQ2448_4001 [Microbotryum intermedium]